MLLIIVLIAGWYIWRYNYKLSYSLNCHLTCCLNCCLTGIAFNKANLVQSLNWFYKMENLSMNIFPKIAAVVATRLLLTSM
jgi:hypothetical protein